MASLQENETHGLTEENLATLLKQFMQDVITPEKNRIARRLFLIADFLQRTGCDRELVERTPSAALNLPNERLPYLEQSFSAGALPWTASALPAMPLRKAMTRGKSSKLGLMKNSGIESAITRATALGTVFRRREDTRRKV
ncbi:MAG: hypothetical protein M0C28_21305 [Candidatus Moduliflexus flocculans]|nr:hypothetical protein [Candidatus Moduliflexus flocculans]